MQWSDEDCVITTTIKILMSQMWGVTTVMNWSSMIYHIIYFLCSLYYRSDKATDHCSYILSPFLDKDDKCLISGTRQDY